MDNLNYYEILQVYPNAEIEIIKAAYKKLAQKYHPDVGGSQEKMAQINEAYKVLSDATLREQYDKMIFSGYANDSAYEQEGSVQRPWLRYFARMFDYYIATNIISVLVVLFAIYAIGFFSPDAAIEFYLYLENAGSLVDYGFYIIIIAAWSFIESLMINSWGTTPGKWMLGINVLGINGKMSRKDALNRHVAIFIKGIGLGIPIYTLYTLFKSYDFLKENNTTPWDIKFGGVVSYEKIKVWKVIVMVGLLAIALYYLYN